MSEFYKRLLSGIVYVVILLSGIVLHQYAFLSVIAILSVICLWEFQRLIHLKSYVDLYTYHPNV